jgi:hypothetical protein
MVAQTRLSLRYMYIACLVKNVKCRKMKMQWSGLCQQYTRPTVLCSGVAYVNNIRDLLPYAVEWPMSTYETYRLMQWSGLCQQYTRPTVLCRAL